MDKFLPFILFKRGITSVIFLLTVIISHAQITPTAGIVYVKEIATGTGTGNSWANATSDLQGAINASGVTKVFVAIGNYNSPAGGFVMKNNVAIYGGFDPANGITALIHNRILPTEDIEGTILNGESTKRIITNDNNGLNNTAVLDGFTIRNGYANGFGREGVGGGIYNNNSSPTFLNLVIRNNLASNSGGGIANFNSPIILSNTLFLGNNGIAGGGIFNQGSNTSLSNVIFKGNTSGNMGGVAIYSAGGTTTVTNALITGNYQLYYITSATNANIILNNVTIANNNGQYAMRIVDGGTITANNSVIFGTPLIEDGTYTAQYTFTEGNTNTANGNINTTDLSITDVFKNPYSGDFTLKSSLLINKGNNALFPNLNANTKDLSGNLRLRGATIDLGAYEFIPVTITPTNGIVYVKTDGTGNGSSWANATSDLHTAIQTTGVSKVFVATGTYNVGANSFVMKNGVEIYGGFDPANGITDLTHNRIMPNAANTNGSILNGEGVRPVIWNVFTSATAMNNTAILDGFTITNGSYANGAGIRNVYASPTLRNLVVRTNNATSSGAGIYNENSNPDIYNTVISGNMIVAPFGQNGMGAGIYNVTNSAPTIVNTTIVNNTITGIGASPVMVGAGVANLNSAAPKIYNSIIWNNQKNGVANTAGADIENNSASLTLKNSITQLYSTGNAGDYNKVGSNPLFSGSDFQFQGNSPALNAGSYMLFTGLNATTKDLAGHPRVGGSAIDIGAYEYTLLPDINGVIYVREGFTGLGTSWADATGDLHNAIHATNVQKVFVASGNYNVGDHSFIMKNNVEIYGGFDPANGIIDLSHNRIMPNAANTNGSVLNGQNIRPVVWNEYSVQNQLYSTAVLDGFTIMNGLNTGLQGAGIYNFGASPTLRNLVLRNNVMTSLGAALYNVGSNTVVTNVSIINNTGRGVVNSQSSPQFTNVLISGNTAAGVYNWGNTYTDVGTYTNVTIANNGLPFEADAYSHFKNSILWDDINNYNYGGENNLIKGNVSTANGNLNTLLMTPSDIFTDYANGDYTLVSGSPAINMGSNALFTGLTANTKDLAGTARVYNFANGGIIDMGAYESPYEPLAPDTNGIIYVKTIYSGTGSGKDWSNATADLHNAIHTNGVTKVFVAIGNYPVGSSSFVMKNNVEIYGGFDPDNNIKTLNDSRILPNHGVSEGSVLDGQNTKPLIWNDFTSATALNNSAVLDGFTLKNGNLNSGYGGGIHNVYASPTLRNLLVKTNRSLWGGGISAQSASSPKITDVILYDNFSYGAGGGGAGAMYSDDGAPVLTNVSIIANRANLDVGGYMCRGGNPVFNNVTIVGNQKQGFWASNGGNISLNNSIVLNNVYTSGGTYISKYSLIEGNTDFTNGNINPSGITVAAVFTDPTNGDYTLKIGSPAVNTGSNALNVTTTDLAGNTRIQQATIDLGAYESIFAPITPDANNILYVDINVSGGNGSGDSWTNAIPQLADAMKYARGQFIADATVYDVTPLKIYVAKGTYKPMYSARDNYYTVDETRDNAFVMVKNVQVYGGFDPENGIDDLTDTRIFGANGSVLSAEVGYDHISGDEAYHVVISSGAVGSALLNGFTLRDAYSNYLASGYIQVFGYYPIFRGSGGAISCIFSSPTIENCIITKNLTSQAGGIFNYQTASPTIINCTFIDNGTTGNGGAIYNSTNSSPTIINCNFTDNGGENGGAIYNVTNSNPIITNCSFTDNSSRSNGGGAIYNIASSPIITNSLFANNSARNSISVGIWEEKNGGAIYNETTSSPVLTNVTIADNLGANTVYSTGAGSSTFNNSIVFGTVSATYTAQNSLIEGNAGGTNGNLDGTSIVAADVFINASGGNYGLKYNSLAINAGSNALFSGLNVNTLDLAGNARVYDFANGGIIDLGAYEHIVLSDNIIYVNINVVGGTGDGSSWANAIPELADALKYARLQYDADNTVYDAQPLKIFVAKGTYKPLYSARNNYYTQTGSANPPYTDQDNAFVMVKNVQIYGGFDPENGITDLTDPRIFGSNGSILSADIQGNEALLDNSFHVVISSNDVGNAVLNGFYITDAYSLSSNSGQMTVFGYPVINTLGAMYCVRSSPTIENCIFYRNYLNAGGTLYNYQQSSPTITNCSFIQNTPTSGGGTTSGGAIYNSVGSSPIITNCSFTQNSTTNGGAISNSSNSNPIITNCSFKNNYGSEIIRNDASSPIITNSLFANNNGSAIYNESTSSPVLTNVTIADNIGANTVYSTGSGSTTFNNSIVFGTVSAAYTAQNSLIEGNTDFTNGNINMTGITVSDVFTDNTNGDYTLKYTSPVIDMGNNTFNSTTLDLAGNARIYNSGIIDLGAYESEYTPAVPITPDANNILYVNINVTGGNGSGNSWANAIPQLADAMKYARAQYIADATVYDATPLKIYVAKGTYKPMYSPRNYYYTVDEGRDNAFTMVKNVQIYGGFDPDNGIDDLTDTRIFGTGGSILSGDIGSVNTDLDNASHVVVSSNEVGSALLDGFTIRDAYYGTGSGTFITVNTYPVYRDFGAIYNVRSSPSFVNCLITGNQTYTGGGMYNYQQSSPTLTNCSFINNYIFGSGGSGGAINNTVSCSPIISNCTFTNNSSSAIYNSTNSSPIITNCSFTNNPASEGGAIYNNASSPIIINSLFANNGNAIGTVNGGAIYNVGTSSPALTNVSIANNYGLTAIYATAGSTTINNSIVLGGISATYTAQHSLIEGNADFTNGNLDASGLAAADVFNDPTNEDFTLKSGASAINAGNNALNASTTDLAGNPRIQYATIDLGAYESSFASILPDVNGIVYVRPLAYGDGSGMNWANATSNLQGAIDGTNVQKVYVAIGNYPVGGSSYVMKNDVAIYGGFDPDNGIATLADARILPTELVGGSVLDGLNTRPLIWNDNNGLTNTAMLDGFTLMNGYGNIAGGMYNNAVAPTYTNLVIKNNEATTAGGGIYNLNAPITLTNAIITNNTALYGGGVRNNNSTAEFTNVIIKNNSATLATGGAGGGGIFNELSNLKLTNVLITDNSTQRWGGGFRNLSGNPVFTNVTLANNTAVNQTATTAMEIVSGTPEIRNSIIYGTTTGIYTTQYSLIQGNADFDNGNINPSGISETDVFNDPANGDYTLDPTSVAIDAGSVSLYSGNINSDKDLAGSARLMGASIDLGAYEYSFPLPIELMSFTVQKSGETVILDWATASELNNRGFEIERSTEGKYWKQIGYQTTLAEHGNSQSRLYYRYADRVPEKGINYYRLKQLDIDGNFEYSPIRSVEFEPNQAQVVVYPNPTDREVYVSGLSGVETIRLADATGKVLQTIEHAGNRQAISLISLDKGMYLLQVISPDGNSRTLKVIKL